MADAFGGYGMPTSGIQQFQQQYAFPQLAEQLVSSLASPVAGAAQQLPQFMQNPAASPVFQQQLQGLLAALEPSEQRAQQSLTNAARGAGMLSSGVFGRQAGALQSDILRNRQTTAADLLGRTYGTTINALMAALGLAPEALQAMKLASGGRAGATTSSRSAFGGEQLTSPQLTGDLLSPTGPSAYGGGGGTYARSLSGLLGSSGGGYSPLNPGTTDYERAIYSQYGMLPAQLEAAMNLPPSTGTYIGSGGDFLGGSSPTLSSWFDQSQQPTDLSFYEPLGGYADTGGEY